MIIWIPTAVLALCMVYIGGWCRGWVVGVKETEVRWSEAVGRANNRNYQ